MKKKIGAVLAAGVMALAMPFSVALSGCNSAKITEFEMPDGGYDGSKVTITFANTTGQDKAKIIDDAIKDFNVLYPNINVVVDNTVKSYDTLCDNIATKINGGKQPHIAFCYSDHVALYNQSKAVLAIDDFLPTGAFKNMKVTNTAGTESLGLTKEQYADYVDAFIAEGKVYGDGKTYTLPFAKSTEVLYYNENFFTTNNLKVPETWDEVEKVCADILTIIGDDKTKYPLGYDSDANLFITMCEQHDSPYTSASGDKHFLFDNKENQDFVKKLVEWRNKGYLITQATNNDTFTSYLFTEEKCFMSVGSTGGSSYQDPGSTDGTAKFNVGVARIPQVDKDNPKAILQGPSVCIFKKSNPQEVLASWLLVKYLTTNANFQGRYSEISGYMPVTKSAYNSPLYQEFLEENNLTARTAKICKKMVDDEAFYTSDAFVGSSKARERVEILMKSAFSGDDLAETFAKAIRACEEFVQNQG